MSSTKFLAILPQKVQSGDRIRLKAKIETDAEEFSINFANETCPNPDNITYHFKWLLLEKIIVEAYKDNTNWMNHKESDYNQLDAKNDSFLGSAFALEFAFQDDVIYVYLLEDGGHNLITQFEPQFELSAIESVQIWGDVEKVNELTFAYK